MTDSHLNERFSSILETLLFCCFSQSPITNISLLSDHRTNRREPMLASPSYSRAASRFPPALHSSGNVFTGFIPIRLVSYSFPHFESKSRSENHNSDLNLSRKVTGAPVCTRRSTLKVTCRRARERVIEEESSQMAETNKQSFKVSSGEKSPLGVSQVDKGINFALFSQNATSVTLCLSLPQRLKIICFVSCQCDVSAS